MFNQAVEFIKDSAITIVGLAVGILGLGDAEAFDLQDVSLKAEMTGSAEIKRELSNDLNIFTIQPVALARVLPVVSTETETETEIVNESVGSDEISGGIVEKNQKEVVDKTKDDISVIKDIVGIIVSIVDDVAKTIGEMTGAIVEQTGKMAIDTVKKVNVMVEAGIEVAGNIAEEVSAMIKVTNITQSLGNMREVLQSSVTATSDGTGDILQTIGGAIEQSANIVAETTIGIVKTAGKQASEITEDISGATETIAESVYKIVNATAKITSNFIINIWDKIKINMAVSQIDNWTFAVDKTAEWTEKLIQKITIGTNNTVKLTDKVIAETGNATGSLTATIKDFTITVGSDLKNIGGEINDKIDGVDFSPKELVKSGMNTGRKMIADAFNFFQTHRPL